MRKLISLLLLLVVIAALPLVFGLIAKNNLYKMVNYAQAHQPFNIEIVDYHSGWLQSSATIKLSLIGEPDLAVMIKNKIYHGPIIFTAAPKQSHPLIFARALVTSTLNVNSQQLNQFSHASGLQINFDAPWLTYHLLIGYTGNMDFQYTAKKLSITLDQGNMHGNFSSDGFTGEHKIGAHFSSNDGKVIIKKLAFSTPDIQFSLPQQLFSINQKRDPSGLNIGSISYHIPTINVMNPPHHMTISELYTDSNADITDGQLHFLSHSSIKNIQFNHTNIGPFTLSLQLKNLDANAMGQLVAVQADLISKTKQTQIQQNSQLSTQQYTGMLKDLQDLGAKIISKGPSLDITELSINTPLGKALLTANVNIPNSALADNNPLYQAMQTTASMHIRIPQPLAEPIVVALLKAPMNELHYPIPLKINPHYTDVQNFYHQQAQKQIQLWKNAKLLKLEQGDYIIDINFSNMQLKLNNRLFQPTNFSQISIKSPQLLSFQQLITLLKEHDQTAIADQFENNMHQAYQTIDPRYGGKILFGQIVTEDGTTPKQLTSTVTLLDNGYFLVAINNQVQHITFSHPGYQTITLDTPRNREPIANVGTIVLKKQ